MMNSPAMSAKEFAEKLNSGNLKSSAHIFGKVKKSESKNEVLFAFKAPELNWMPLPISMIEHVHVIKSFKIGDEDVSLVKIKLNQPSDKDARVLYDLLAGMSEKLMRIWMMKKKMMMGEHKCGHVGHDEHHKYGCHHSWHHHD
jgi:hypothetical protein